MRSKRAPSPPQSWPIIAIGYVVFALFLGGAAAAYAFVVFDVQATCRRDTDLCEVVEIRPFWRDVTESFRPSQVEEARFIWGRKGSSCVLLDMKGGAPEIRLCSKFGEHFSQLFNAFIADPTQARLEFRVDRNFIDYAFVAMIVCFSLIPFWGATTDAIRRLRMADKPR